MAKHGKAITPLPRRSTAPRSTPPFRLLSSSRSSTPPSSTRPSEAHFRLGIDTRKADQNIRGSISLPTAPARPFVLPSSPRARRPARPRLPAPTSSVPTSSSPRFRRARSISTPLSLTPNMMAKVGRIGKILGPRGLMPNPKLGTVTMDVAKMVSELKAGRVEYRADRYGICHVPLGKKSFSEQQLVENYAALYTEIPCASSPLLLRASTLSPSPCLPPWALASRSTPLSSVTFWLSNC